jgi:S-adenosylmethionine decarboxylase
VHLLIDGYGGDSQKMQDQSFLLRFLDEYPSVLGMTKMTKPTILNYAAPQPEDSGLSGFVVIAESHVSVHTFPQRNYVNIDIFSCKSFDSQRALQDVKDIFGLLRVKSWVVDRGLEHYDPQMLMPGLARESVPGAGDS